MIALATFLLLGCVATSHAATKSKGASISLRARWNGTAHMAEAGEFLADEGLYWDFLLSSAAAPGPSDPEQCWQHMVDLASEKLSPGMKKLLPLSLSSRQYSAKVEMYRQIAAEVVPSEGTSCCYVDINGQMISSEADVKAQLRSGLDAKSCTSQVLDVDHVYGDKEADNLAVLYGPPGAACVGQYHKILAEAVDASSGKLAYIMRPFTPPQCQLEACPAMGSDAPVWLSGYGVEAALKNTEYSARDDSKKESDEAADKSDADAAGALGEVGGFLFDTLLERRPAMKEELLTLRDHIESAEAEEAEGDGSELKIWAMRDLGLQAAQRVAQAADPLALLMDISQNFPGIAPSLSRQRLNESIRSAVAHDQNYLPSGFPFLMLNGMAVEVDPLDYYGLLERLRIEVRLRTALDQLGLPPQEALKLLALRAETSGGAQELASTRLSLGLHEDKPGTIPSHVSFINDLEKDAMYAHLPNRLKQLLNVYPGRLKPLARNIFTAIAIANPLSTEGLALAQTMYQLYVESYPIRFGLSMVVPESVKRARAGAGEAPPVWDDMSAEEQFALAFITMREAFGGQPAFSFWASVSQGMTNPDAKWEIGPVLKTSFEDNWALASKSISTDSPSAAQEAATANVEDVWEQMAKGTGFSEQAASILANMSSYMLSKGIATLGEPHIWFNGLLDPMESTSGIDQVLLQKLMAEMQKVQEGLYYGKIKDTVKVPVLAQILKSHGSLNRWSPSIINSAQAKDASLSKLGESLKPHKEMLEALSVPGHTAGMPRIHAATHYVLADLKTKAGQVLLHEAMRFLSNDEESNFAAASSRVTVLPHPGDQPTLLEALIILACKSSEADRDVPSFILSVLADDSLAAALAEPTTLTASGAWVGAWESHRAEGSLEEADHIIQQLSAAELSSIRSGLSAAWDAVGLSAGESAVVSNANLFVVASASREDTQDVSAEDFTLLQMLIKDYSPAGAIASTLQAAYDEGRMTQFAPTVPSEDEEGLPVSSEVRAQAAVKAVAKMDDLVTAIVSILGGVEYPESRLTPKVSKQIQQVLSTLQSKAIEIGDGTGGELGVHIIASLDPLSRPAQRLSQLLSTVQRATSASISLRMNPDIQLTQLPIKTYYRYALPDKMGDMSVTPKAHFTRLPSKRVLTMNMDVPEPWLVEVVQAPYDLDNLLLDEVTGNIARAEFELEGLTLTGSCIDVTQGSNRGTPPRGLQLWLGSRSTPHVVDTLVMENLAYFQLKTKPGRWMMSLAPGRSRELYSLLPAQASGSKVAVEAAEELSTEVLISSLSGKTMVLKVKKRQGMESEDVLGPKDDDNNGDDDDDDEEEDYADMYDEAPKTAPKPKSPSSSPPATTVDDTINVFTIASGHMYERLQKIMILSVIGNTKRRVKFWIIKNYMSPHHRTVVPLMAKQYGFDYEFVTYKWPHWLHKQSEKQRIIWAYKILFLDVLFPLDVNRIIFVDSDQVVRTDLGELMDMDIQGAPFAYTPFCDNNREMDEFRFWKGGFWKDHLRGKPYHISALYLVDLKRFRQKAAGDNLRIVYEQLSRDPNSLANLDQDLPNYAQHNIRIFSLPQEWLWCESWCGNSTKKKAKTIDLCNNPRTKEPKLSAARRIIAEWPALDDEQARFTASVEDVGLMSLQAGMPAAEPLVIKGHDSSEL